MGQKCERKFLIRIKWTGQVCSGRSASVTSLEEQVCIDERIFANRRAKQRNISAEIGIWLDRLDRLRLQTSPDPPEVAT